MTSMYEQVDTNTADPVAGSRIDPVLARSWLLVNGAHGDRFESAAHSRADIVVLDIEDAVAPKDKHAAGTTPCVGLVTETLTGCASTASAHLGGRTI